MVYYTCSNCSFTTNLKSNYKRHLQTQKHIIKLKKQDDENEIIQNNPEIIQNNPLIIQNNPLIIQKSEVFKCDYCDDIFTFFTNKRRHELHRCKKNPLVLKTLIDEKEITISDIEKKHESEKKHSILQLNIKNII